MKGKKSELPNGESEETLAFIAEDEDIRAKKAEQIMVLRKIFEEDIVAYAEFVFPHHCTKPIPGFHKSLYKLYTDFTKRKVAIAAPRGRLTEGRGTNTSDAWPLNLLNSVNLLAKGQYRAKPHCWGTCND